MAVSGTLKLKIMINKIFNLLRLILYYKILNVVYKILIVIFPVQ